MEILVVVLVVHWLNDVFYENVVNGPVIKTVK